MNFDYTPDDYAPVFAPAMYGVYDCEPETDTDIKIIDTYRSATLGIKRFHGSDHYAMNAAGYARKACVVAPATPYQKPTLATRPQQTAKIEAHMGLLHSPVTMLVPSKAAVQPGARLSNSPAVNRIARDGFDEMSFIVKNANLNAELKLSGPGAICSVDSNTIFVEHDMVTLSFSMDGMGTYISQAGFSITDFDEMEAVVYRNGKPMIRQKYLFNEPYPEAVTLGWLNPLGAVDCYAFPHISKQTIEAKRQSAESNYGYRLTTGMQSHTLTTAVSDFEPRATTEWLSEIISSPLVWALSKDGYARVEVVTAQATLKDDTPGRISVTYRPALVQTGQILI